VKNNSAIVLDDLYGMADVVMYFIELHIKNNLYYGPISHTEH